MTQVPDSKTEFGERSYGFYAEMNQAFIGFGNKNSQKEILHAAFPARELILLHQTHSDKTVMANSGTIQEGDGHWTRERHFILGVRTADCIPVLAFNESTQTIAAFHAGWKGVLNGIAISGLRQVAKENQFDVSDWQLSIGPHIGFNSFIVRKDVSEVLLIEGSKVNLKAFDPQWHVQIDDTFERFNLLNLLKKQLIGLGLSKITELTLDTFTDSRFFSFRREPLPGGRQISFIGFKNEL